MALKINDTVELIVPNFERNRGCRGTVTGREGDYITVKLTYIPESATPDMRAGEEYSYKVSRWQLVDDGPKEIRYADLQVGDKIKSEVRNITTGTKRITEGTVEKLTGGRTYDKAGVQLAIGNLNGSPWSTQQIWLLDRPEAPKFDTQRFGSGAVLGLVTRGYKARAVKTSEVAWTVVVEDDRIGVYTDEELAALCPKEKFIIMYNVRK